MANPRSSHTDALNFFGAQTPPELTRIYGSPLYVYNENILRERCRELRRISRDPAFEVNYSVKANSNPELLKIIREEGLRVDAMSPGELMMDRLAGYETRDVLYVSNNNGADETAAALSAGCLISVDSLSQLEQLGRLAPGGRAMIRVNPGIGEGHHAKVVTGGANSKFGVDPAKIDDALAILKKYNLRLAGLNQHIGSLFMRPDNYLAAAAFLTRFAQSLPPDVFSQLEILDFGGGLGIPYRKYDREERLDLAALSRGLNGLMSEWRAASGYKGKFYIEPGRYVAAECGVLLGTATAVKQSARARFVGCDIGFNVLQRPVMYDAFHDVEIYSPDDGEREETAQTIVGNICESGDILAKNRVLPLIREGDVIGLLDAGAYGFSMASNYNERSLPAEVLIDRNGESRLIRRRQTLEDLASCLKL